MHYHPIKATKSFQTVQQLKRATYVGKTMFVPSTIIKHKNQKNVLKEPEIVQQVSLRDKLSFVPVMESPQGII